ncbi:JAB domain-containing protein [Myroides sp. LJL116]
MNNANVVTNKVCLSKGGLICTIVDLRILFKAALDHRATSLILIHNHPSGNLIPSEADFAVTKRIQAGASTLDIRVLDHVIISSEGFYSFADKGEI